MGAQSQDRVQSTMSSQTDFLAERSESAKVNMAELNAMTDDELLFEIGRDSEAAYRLLVERHIDRGYAVAVRILRNPSDAEDVVQEAFLQVWTKRDLWQPDRARFSTWLYRVVSNRCIDLLRRPKVETMETLPELEDDRQDQVQSLVQQEASDTLKEAMTKLPDQQRIALVFSYNENLSNTEIAEIMDTTVSAVESLLKRGRQKLRHLLRSNGGEILSTFTNG
ncbi:RNA polymerase sigma factor [Roseibium algae]|uniref:RNA polymerase sigma factor n=1 Tax=Roseibium algae TaxID=3123038 RepID=A0ABU8TEJ8_9HYPH